MSWFYDTSVSVSLSPSSVFMHIHACECTYVDQKIAYDMIPKVFFFRQCLSLAWSSPSKLDWLVIEPQVSLHLCLTDNKIMTT